MTPGEQATARAAKAERILRAEIAKLAMSVEDTRKIAYINKQVDSPHREDDDKQFLKGVRSSILRRYNKEGLAS